MFVKVTAINFSKGQMMLHIEIIDNFSFPVNKRKVNLFRDKKSNQGIFIGTEIARLMEYNSLSHIINKKQGWIQKIHFYLLKGKLLTNFQKYLQQKNIKDYAKSKRLLLITETGILFLLGRHCKEQAMRAGEWLLTKVLPNLRNYEKDIYCKKIKSSYLDLNMHIFIYKKRFGILDVELESILEESFIDYITYGCRSFIENIHIDSITPDLYKKICTSLIKLSPEIYKSKNYFYYGSGIYRFLNYSRHPITSLIKIALEKEIFPIIRKADINWDLLSIDDKILIENYYDIKSAQKSIKTDHLNLNNPQTHNIRETYDKVMNTEKIIEDKLENIETNFIEFCKYTVNNFEAYEKKLLDLEENQIFIKKP